MDKMTKAEIQVRGILAGKTNGEILDEVLAVHGAANTSKFCVAWYRNKIKNPGKIPSVDKIVQRVRDETAAKDEALVEG